MSEKHVRQINIQFKRIIEHAYDPEVLYDVNFETKTQKFGSISESFESMLSEVEKVLRNFFQQPKKNGSKTNS